MNVNLCVLLFLIYNIRRCLICRPLIFICFILHLIPQPRQSFWIINAFIFQYQLKQTLFVVFYAVLIKYNILSYTVCSILHELCIFFGAVTFLKKDLTFLFDFDSLISLIQMGDISIPSLNVVLIYVIFGHAEDVLTFMSSHPARLIGLCVWRDLHLLSFHKQHPDGKKKKKEKTTTRSLHIRLCAPDANSLYNNLLNVISHHPIKLNKLGVTAGFGHLCGWRKCSAAAQGERELLKWMLMYCSSSGLVDINASFLWSAKVVYNDGLLAAPSLAFPPLGVLSRLHGAPTNS